MAVTQTQQPQMGLTFQDVWAALMELRESQKETDRQMKETDRKLGKLGSRFGEVIEYMIVPNLVAKFNELGYSFGKTSQNVEIADREHGIFAEVDVFLENGDCAMIVETKAKPNTHDIVDHIERMEKLRASADLHNDTRKYYGAIAGVVMSENVKNLALNKGFYAIEPSGETFTITEPTGAHKPKAW
jgi:hypothetical protein